MSNSLRVWFQHNRRFILWALGLLVVYFFAFHNLDLFPQPWFDEGSHLHVPKTLVEHGRYADISSEGFRYYGPTIGVGPTVMLPIAGVFKVFGIGLLQARLVMVLYMLAALYTFYRLSETLSGPRVAWVALALLVSSRSVLFLQYGRQLLGEVPGFFFMALALYLWLSRWNENGWKRLSVIGLLFGLSMITKYQYLLFLAPTLILAWGLDVFYYKTSTHRNFLIPGILAAGSFGIWQVLSLQYLGPATMIENLALLRASAEGAAFNFNLAQLDNNFQQLTSRAVYLGAIFPGLIYGLFMSLSRTREGQKSSILFLLVTLNLVWFVIASIGWVRYAFLGLTFSTFFIARLFSDITDNFSVHWEARAWLDLQNAARLTLTLWLAAVILIPLSKTIVEIARPRPNDAESMARYINETIPMSSIIETWDPEMGFLTDHNFHYPPNELLAIAVNQVNYGGEPVQSHYDFLQTAQPEYLLLGEFSKWTDIYPFEYVQEHYTLLQTFGDYDLYQRVGK